MNTDVSSQSGAINDDFKSVETLELKNLSHSELETLAFALNKENKQLQQSVNLESYKYRTLFDLNPEPVFVMNLKGFVLEANKKVTEITGFTKDEIVGKHIFQLPFLKVIYLPKYLRLFMGIVKGEIQSLKNIQWEDKFGETRFSNVFIKLLHNTDGKLEGFMAIVPDITQEKRGKKHMVSSDQTYHDLIEKAQIAVFTDNRDEKITSANKRFLELFKYDKADIEQLELKQWIHPADYDMVMENHKNRLSAKKALTHYEYRALTKTGETIWCDVEVIPIEENGELIGTRSYLWDITNRKNYEKKLEESEEKYRSLFEKHSAIKLIMDSENGNIYDANLAALNFYGWTKEELKAMNISQINTLSKEEIDDQLALARSNNKTNFEFKHRKANGEIKDVEIYTSGIILGGKKYFHSIVHDVSNRKKAEKELKESEEFNRTLFENAQIGFLLNSLDGKMLDVNETAAKMIGYTINEMCQLTYWELTPQKYEQQELVQLESLNTKGFYGPYEKEYIHKDGHLVPVRLNGKIIERKGEKFIWSSIEDISDRRQAEIHLAQKHKIDEALARLFVPLSKAATSLNDIAMAIYNEAINLTSSEFCYVGTIGDQNKDSLVTHTLSELFDNKKCTVLLQKNKKIEFKRAADGKFPALFGHSLNTKKAFFTNEIAKHPASTGVPKGHIPISKFLSAPVLLDNELVGQIALANPENDYTENNLKAVMHLAEYMALAIQRHKASEELAKSTDELKAHAKELQEFNKMMIDREMRIIEMKEEVNELCKKLNMEKRYPEDWK